MSSALEPQAASLGGTASDVVINKVALGLMMLMSSEYASGPEIALTATPVPDEQAFEAIKAAIDHTPKDRKLLLNSGEFY
ncbi:hypothetical protein FS837_005423, partial [Tulasnella sp. UAMH 9824]